MAIGGSAGHLNSVNQGRSHSFATIPEAKRPRSAFNESFRNKMTLNAGTLIPFFNEEIYPGDTIKLNATIFARLSTPLKPAMDNLAIETQYFFVPNRLLWIHWEQFCGAQVTPGDSTSYTVPQIGPALTWGEQTVGDYMNVRINTNVGGTASPLSALPFRAMNLIYNDWYRDENLVNPATWGSGAVPANGMVPGDDGPDAGTQYGLLARGKRKDYFTSCLPWTQKGTPINLLSGTAPVVFDGNALQLKGQTSGVTSFAQTGGTTTPPVDMHGAGWTNAEALQIPGGVGTSGWGMMVDLNQNAIDTVNTFRLAVQVQRFLERQARGGTRMVELLLSQFGVVSPDFRLQRPEYLGGGSSQINYTPIPQTSSTSTGNTKNVGDLAGFATALARGPHGFSKSFVEHGWVIGFLSIRADLAYQQGLPRKFARKTIYDYYWPTFQALSEQPVLNREIYCQGDAAGANHDGATFGYQERWAELRSRPNEIHGYFRSDSGTAIDYWHFAEKYASLPTLGSTWIADPALTTVDRNLVTTHAAGAPQLLADILFDYTIARILPTYSVPGMMDHF